MTIEQLKAKAYDALAQVEHWQRELQKINQQIANFKVEEKPDEVA